MHCWNEFAKMRTTVNHREDPYVLEEAWKERVCVWCGEESINRRANATLPYLVCNYTRDSAVLHRNSGMWIRFLISVQKPVVTRIWKHPMFLLLERKLFLLVCDYTRVALFFYIFFFMVISLCFNGINTTKVLAIHKKWPVLLDKSHVTVKLSRLFKNLTDIVET